MAMYDYTLRENGVTVRSGSMWLEEPPLPGRIEFSTGDQWWRCTEVAVAADPTGSGQIVCEAVPPETPDSPGS
jgi:hypothetical protein